MTTKLRCVVFLLIIGLSSPAGVAALAGDDAVEQALRDRVEQLRGGEAMTIQGARIAANRFISAFYEQRQFQLAWTDAGNVETLAAAIVASREDGLDVQQFHAESIRRLREAVAEGEGRPGAIAELDILLTDTLVRLGYQLFYGKVDPEQLDPDWNFDKPLLVRDPVQTVASALRPGALSQFLTEVRLDHPYYLTLKAALRSYREIASSGGWSAIPAGPTLKPGMSDPRVTALRLRLAAGGDYDGTGTKEPDFFDESLEAAVRRFQERHGLGVDGVVGPATLAELNVSIEARIDQIRVNMERARWVLRNIRDDFVIVNIAGFYVEVVRSGKSVWRSPAIVGKPFRKTPVFTADMSYLVINPTWTVPPTILRKDILPKVKTDPSYLTQKRFSLIDSDGQTVDPAQVDWATVSHQGFPYRIVQQPGPNNALGLVKFMFPNKHFVYLHDTPSQTLFESSERTFSSGCIRVQDPFHLADLLLSEQPEWDHDKIEAVKQSGQMTTVKLARSLPVLLLYWTVDPDPGGDVRFYRDVYERDAAILKALNAEFHFKPKN